MKPEKVSAPLTDVGSVDETLDIAEVEVGEHRRHKLVHPVLGSLYLQSGARDFVERPLSSIVCFLGSRIPYMVVLQHQKVHFDEEVAGNISFQRESEDADLVQFFQHIAVVDVEAA